MNIWMDYVKSSMSFLKLLSEKVAEVKDEVSDFTEKDATKETRAGKEAKTATG